MALDPSLLTPAAVKAKMQNDQSFPSLQNRVLENINRPPVETNFLNMVPGQQLNTTPTDDATAQQIGANILGPDLSDVSPSAIESMALRVIFST